jgi:RimJ/RimL family protein N-acetyltransferase
MTSRSAAWREAWSVVGSRFPLDACGEPGAVTLVPAGREHNAFFLACRNDADAVRHSRSHRVIGREEHAQWFSARIDDPGTRLRVGVVQGELVGTVRVDVRAGVGEVGIAVAPACRGQGLGTALLEALLDDVAADPQVVALTASIHVGNTPSMRAFARVGFVPNGADGEFRLFRRDSA